MSESAANAMLLVGKITGCYGIKGWVRIHPYTEPQENFLGFGQWMLKRRSGLEPIEFDAGKRQGKGLVAHIAGVDDRTLAESYKGARVRVALKDAKITNCIAQARLQPIHWSRGRLDTASQVKTSVMRRRNTGINGC